MTRNVVWLRRFGWVGVWLLLGACAGTNSDGEVGGAAGAWHAPDAGGQGSSAGAGDAGASTDGASGAASTMNVGLGGSEDDPSHGNGRGGNRGQNPGSRAGASGKGASGEATAGADVGTGGEAPLDEFMIPCDVSAATRVCRHCHIDPPVHGAPMPLLTLEDLQTYADRASRAIQTGAMPATGELSAQEAALIVAWLDEGAPGVPTEICP